MEDKVKQILDLLHLITIPYYSVNVVMKYI